MTDLKFRAWHIDERRMFPVCELRWMEDGLYVGEDIDGRTHLYSLLAVVPMQFTGRYGKDEVEIYAKDIVSHRAYGGEIMTIEWDSDYAQFVGVRPKNRSDYELMDMSSQMEKIGTVFESPELLGGDDVS